MGSEPSPAPRPTRRGIYLLPNLFTTAALFAGFYAVVAAWASRFRGGGRGRLVRDAARRGGRAGRPTHATPDRLRPRSTTSLSDMVSFGVAPALVVYEWVPALHRASSAGSPPSSTPRPGAPACPLQHPGRGGRQALLPGPAEPFGPPRSCRPGSGSGTDQGLTGEGVRHVASALTVVAGLLDGEQPAVLRFKGLDAPRQGAVRDGADAASSSSSWSPSNRPTSSSSCSSPTRPRGPVVTLVQRRRRRASRRGPPARRLREAGPGE